MPPVSPPTPTAAREMRTESPEYERIPPCLWCTYEILRNLHPNPCYNTQWGECLHCRAHGRKCEPIHDSVAEKVKDFANCLKDSFAGEGDFGVRFEETEECKSLASSIMVDIRLWDRFVAVGAIKSGDSTTPESEKEVKRESEESTSDESMNEESSNEEATTEPQRQGFVDLNIDDTTEELVLQSIESEHETETGSLAVNISDRNSSSLESNSEREVMSTSQEYSPEIGSPSVNPSNRASTSESNSESQLPGRESHQEPEQSGSRVEPQSAELMEGLEYSKPRLTLEERQIRSKRAEEFLRKAFKRDRSEE